MLKSYFKTAFRNLIRNPLFTILNILGLAAGLACTILIVLWATNELSYDRNIPGEDRIYRVTSTAMGQTNSTTSYPLGDAVKEQVPGIKYMARMSWLIPGLNVVTVGQRHFEQTNVFYADPDLLRIFSFPMVRGDTGKALIRPDGILLTQATAKKFFGTDDVVGRPIDLDGHGLVVTGILKDLPANFHLRVEALLPMAANKIKNEKYMQWENLNYYTYFQFDTQKDLSDSAVARMEREITAISRRADASFDVSLGLQPLQRIHLYSKQLRYDIASRGDIAYVRLFSVIAFFILLVACVNFMNLSTARSAGRAREVGVRKVVGAARLQLVGQFLCESLLITAVALVVAVALVGIALPAYNAVLGSKLCLDFGKGWLVGGLLAVFLLTSLMAGSYPAFFLSGFKPINVLKTKFVRAGKTSRYFRSGLVVFQFVVSIVLIVGTSVVYSQLRYIRNRDLGFDKSNLLYMRMKGRMQFNSDAGLVPALRESRHIRAYTLISELPVNASMATIAVQWKGMMKNDVMFNLMGVDEHFLSVFKIKLVAGRTFSPGFGADTMNYIVNEKALAVMGMDAQSALGQEIGVWGNRGMIVGVVNDFSIKPAQSAVDPLILRYNPGKHTQWARNVVVVSAAPGGTEGAIDDLRAVWKKLNSEYSFEYGFVDQALENLYVSEQRLGKLFNIFSVLAIFICCLGLWGLAAYTAEQRTKEIGIRKVLGARVTGIVVMLAGGFLRLVLIALGVATPIAWYSMHRWLQDFAYRVRIDGWYFAAAGAIATAIALLTVSWQAVRAAVANPVKSLRAD
jgi:putative ABC transport system permease protein